MRKLLLFFSLILAFICAKSQSEALTPAGSLNITKEVKPPILNLVSAVSFVEPSGNNAIDADERCKIIFTVKNSGMGDGIGLSGKINATGSTAGLSYSGFSIPTIKVGTTTTIEFPITSNMDTEDGTAEFVVEITEPNGFGLDKQYLNVSTRKFVSPMLEIVDYSVTGNNAGVLEKKSPFDLQLLLQNTQYGLAENIEMTINVPAGVFILSGNETTSFEFMKAGEQQSVVCQIIVSDKFTQDNIPIKVSISEKYGKYSKNKDINLKINQQLAAGKIDVKPVVENNKPDIVIGSLTSDVDKNIPVNNSKTPNRFALIFGNEDYHSYQRTLNSEADVAFAINDASVFKEYCVNALGVEERNVTLITNATVGAMSRAIETTCKLLKQKGSNAELIFYYAGHGFPDEVTKEPYIIPVDVSAANLSASIKLYDLYAMLSNTGAGKITIFMDACFSGGGREAGPLAVRGVKVEPKKETLNGNIVVFSATKNDQTALPYDKQQHGMFTYFLLKKLQQSSTQCSYQDLYEFINDGVSEYSLRVHSKDQNPEINAAQNVLGMWNDWHF
ncbi:MAG: caspase family protein [Bacteroidales bacterium]|jgi:hypothetical protein|nr:caspase family protein [Bacteroidales bacterium]MDD2204519.1 caspase family protein [Bacteroidales bacterium]MDD3152481.1 caspase family protein [Bacteroidales bacterium]MDD3914633.1 caspase family protein [Bacteroidales bacterium]MDD4633798.1 caspase family protein [Bacteroidales bacterium]